MTRVIAFAGSLDGVAAGFDLEAVVVVAAGECNGLDGLCCIGCIQLDGDNIGICDTFDNTVDLEHDSRLDAIQPFDDLCFRNGFHGGFAVIQNTFLDQHIDRGIGICSSVTRISTINGSGRSLTIDNTIGIKCGC